MFKLLLMQVKIPNKVSSLKTSSFSKIKTSSINKKRVNIEINIEG